MHKILTKLLKVKACGTVNKHVCILIMYILIGCETFCRCAKRIWTKGCGKVLKYNMGARDYTKYVDTQININIEKCKRDAINAQHAVAQLNTYAYNHMSTNTWAQL